MPVSYKQWNTHSDLAKYKLYIDMQEEIDWLNRTKELVKELDMEMDGVKSEASTAAILNDLRTKLANWRDDV